MVTIGYSYPYLAIYDGSGETDKYTAGQDFGEGVEYSDSIEVAEDNNFYANNRISESETGTFKSGTASITINGLTPAAAKIVFGLKNTTQVQSTTWDNYDDDTKPPEVGYGHVRKVRDNGVDKYIAFVLPRIQLSVPGEAAKTTEEDIDWQAQELEATILRSLNGKHAWRHVASEPFATETEAYAAVKAFLSQTGVG